MSSIQEIEALWGEDVKIDQNQLGEEQAKVPRLHHKYYKVLLQELAKEHAIKQRIDVLERDLYMYYGNRLTEEERTALGWEPWDRKLIGADEKKYYIDTHPRMVEIKQLYAMQKNKLKYLESILDTVNNRGWAIRNMIEVKKFQNGIS